MEIVDPSMDILMQKVDSKYTLVVLAAKRAREILSGAELEIKCVSIKNVSNALEEIAEDKITYERLNNGIK